MPPTFTELTAISQYDNANSTTFNTPNLTAVANRLYVVMAQASYGTAGRTLSSISGGGLGTWTTIAAASAANVNDNRRCDAAYAWSASPGAAAAIAIAYSAAMTGCAYAVYEITGFDTTTVIGNANTAVGGGVTGVTPTLAAVVNSGSGLLASAQESNNEAITVEGTWTAGENNTGTLPATSARSASQAGVADLSCGFTWTTSGQATAHIIEILPAAVAAVVRPVIVVAPFNVPRSFNW